MSATRVYGSWSARVSTYSTGPDADVDSIVTGGPPEWRELLATSGALAQMKAEYRNAINAALPGDIALCGDEFVGPAHPEPGEFDGYPLDENGGLDFAAIVAEIEVSEIVERHDPDA